MRGMNPLAQYLSRKKIRQTDFAQAVGVTQAMVSRLANGAAHPSPEVALRIEKETHGAVPFHVWQKFRGFARMDGLQ